MIVAVPHPESFRKTNILVEQWDGKMKVEWKSSGVINRVIEIDSVLYFSKDAKKHKIGTDFFTDKEKVEEGEYKIDYSNKPVQLENNWFIEGKN